MILAVDAGEVSALAALMLAAGTWGGIALGRRETRRREVKEQARREAIEPSLEIRSTGEAADAIAHAAASLLAPFQTALRSQAGEIDDLRSAVLVSRAAEEQCQDDLSKVRAKLREVTNHLGLAPAPPPSRVQPPPAPPD